MAGARIAKYPPIGGVGTDLHQILPPSSPPPPPAGPNPAPIPTYNWVVTVNNPACGFALTGKWSWYRVTTEGVGNVLMGHDWGMGQAHVPIPPLATPSIAIRALASSVKYWLPSTPNKDPKDGSTPGGATSVAISFPAWCIPTQDCQDIGGWGFNVATSVCFQLVSTREVGFTWGDLVNGLFAMAGDSLASLIGSALGGSSSSAISEVLRSAAGGAATALFVNWATALLPQDAQNAGKVLIAGAFAIGLGQSPGEVVSAAAGPALDWGSGAAGEAVQGAIDGDRPTHEGMGHEGTPLFE